MRKKYNYFVNGKMMSRKDFMDKLKMDCQKVKRTDWCGDIGIDLCEFDEKKFNHYMYAVNNYMFVVIGNNVYRRKEANL